MLVIPWKYLEEKLNLKLSPNNAVNQLTYFGLETNLIYEKERINLEFIPNYNRSDLLCWQGLINEVSILLGCKIIKSNTDGLLQKKTKKLSLEVNSPNCYELSLTVIRNNGKEDYSSWIKEYLATNKINSVNGIIDAANFVTLESGQTLYVFDFEKFFVNEAGVITIDETTREQIKGANLRLNNQVVDTVGVVNLKRNNSLIDQQTKDLLIVCVNFNVETVRKTARYLNVSNNRDLFVQRAISSWTTNETVSRLVELVSGGQSNVIYNYHRPDIRKERYININHKFIVEKTGQYLSQKVIEDIWKQLHFEYQIIGNEGEYLYKIKIPIYRPDIVIVEDLLEEILRVYDYNKITDAFSGNTSIVSLENDNINRKKKIRHVLANLGAQEIVTYSLVSKKITQFFPQILYKVLASKSEQHEYCRSDLLHSHLETMAYNLAHRNENLLFFEISWVYTPQYCEELLSISGTGKLFNQPFHQLVQDFDYYWLKGILDNLFLSLELEINFIQNPSKILISEIFLEQTKIGYFGYVDPEITNCYQIKQTVLAARISLTKIFDHLDKNSKIKECCFNPDNSVSQKDISFYFPAAVDYKRITRFIESLSSEIGEGSLLEVGIKDIYRDQKLVNSDQISITFALTFQSNDKKSLGKKQLSAEMNSIAQKIEKEFRAELRTR